MPDSAQIEQELKQRQGVAREDTLPPVADKDLQYVPATTQVLYAPPKTGLREKYFSPLLHFVGLLLPEIIIFVLFIFVFMLTMNYFNFISISKAFPKYLALLPHTYDTEGNKKILVNAPFSSETEYYEIEGEFNGTYKDRVLVKYNGQVAELLPAPFMSCYVPHRNELEEVKETNNIPAFCSEVLKSQNYGMKIFIEFTRGEDGVYLIKSLAFL